VIVKIIVEKQMECRFAGETEVLGEQLPQRHFVHHQSHMTRPGVFSCNIVYAFTNLTENVINGGWKRYSISNNFEEYCILGYNAVQSVEN
jgi:hypothetical protein